MKIEKEEKEIRGKQEFSQKEEEGGINLVKRKRGKQEFSQKKQRWKVEIQSKKKKGELGKTMKKK